MVAASLSGSLWKRAENLLRQSDWRGGLVMAGDLSKSITGQMKLISGVEWGWAVCSVGTCESRLRE